MMSLNAAPLSAPPLTAPPLVTAHAGCMGTVANSRASIVAAFASRADIVEVDIRATKDGIVVLTHDDTIPLPGGGRVRVEDLAWEEIRAASAPGGEEGVMRLEMLFDLTGELDRTMRPGRRTVLNLDAKEPSALLVAALLLRARGMESEVIFSGLEIGEIAIAHERLPDFRYLFNADALVPAGRARSGDMDRVCSLASEHGCSGINLEWTRGSAAFVEYARNRGLPVMLWTVDRDEDMRTVLSYGPHSITTNHPDLLAALIGSSGKEKCNVL